MNPNNPGIDFGNLESSDESDEDLREIKRLNNQALGIKESKEGCKEWLELQRLHTKNKYIFLSQCLDFNKRMVEFENRWFMHSMAFYNSFNHAWKMRTREKRPFAAEEYAKERAMAKRAYQESLEQKRAYQAKVDKLKEEIKAMDLSFLNNVDMVDSDSDVEVVKFEKKSKDDKSKEKSKEK